MADDLFRSSDPAADSYRKRWGLFRGLRHSIVRRLDTWFGLHLYAVYSRPVAVEHAPAPCPPGYGVRLFRGDVTEELLARGHRVAAELEPDFVRAALAKGDLCAAVLHDGQIVSFCWQAYSPTHDLDGVYVKFAQRYRYGYHAYTHPDYRGRHLQRMMWSPRDQHDLANGYRHAIAFIRVDNHSSIRSTEAAGHRRLGLAGYFKHGELFVAFRSRAVTEAGFAFFMPGQARLAQALPSGLPTESPAE